jgi:cytochrome c-type biogenesis protein CcmH/NrfG
MSDPGAVLYWGNSMALEQTADPVASPSFAARHVYLLAVIFLVAGLAVGYLLTGSPESATLPSSAAVSTSAGAGAMEGAHAVTMADMKQMADKQVAPLLDKLKSDPNNVALLTQVAAAYHITHQFSDAATYYGRAAQADPKNVAVRTKYAISLYRSGDVDGAISQLNQALSDDPKDANCLFNLGMMRLQGKGDGKGALAAWQQLLKTNPQLSPDRKAAVQSLMAQVLQNTTNQSATGGARNHDGHNSSNQ